MRSPSLLAPLSLSLAVVTLGCHSPEYQKYIEQQEQWASTGADSSGTTGDGDSGGALETSLADADTSDGGSASADAGETTGPDVSGSTDTTTGPGEGASSDSGDASTSGPEPFCGDGVINQDFEECDVPSPDPEGPCTAVCQRERIIFVLSISVQGNLSGLQGADAYCKSQASMAKKADPFSPIKDPNNFKALLSSSKEMVFERHFLGKGPYRLVNGLTVSDSFTALFTAPLQNPVNVDDFGHTRNISVWTATTIDGQPYPGIDFCADWESNEGSSTWGLSNATDSWWIDVGDEVIDNPTTDCYDESALYCVEQE